MNPLSKIPENANSSIVTESRSVVVMGRGGWREGKRHEKGTSKRHEETFGGDRNTRHDNFTGINIHQNIYNIYTYKNSTL